MGLFDSLNDMDKRRLRTVGIAAAIIITLVSLLVIGRLYFADDMVTFINNALGEARRTPFALPVTIAVFSTMSFVGAPQILLIGACVIAFGPEQGFWLSWIATIISGAVNYAAGRLSRAAAQKHLGANGRFTTFIGKNGFLASLAIRLVPSAPFVVVNMAFGAARVGFAVFLGGLAIGVLPKTALIAFAGESVMNVLRGDLASAAFMAVAAIAAWLIVMALVHRFVRRHRDTAPKD